MVTPGQIVHYVWDTVDEFESVWPAMVVAVHDDGTADLTVFHSNGRIAWRDNVIQSAEAAAGAWHSPKKTRAVSSPKVKAAKAEAKADAKAAKAARATEDASAVRNVGALQDDEGTRAEQGARSNLGPDDKKVDVNPSRVARPGVSQNPQEENDEQGRSHPQRGWDRHP